MLDLSVNEISGEFPTALLELTNLRTLRLDGLTGEIPPEIGSLSPLQELRLLGRPEGEIPPQIGSLCHLARDRSTRRVEIAPEEFRQFRRHDPANVTLPIIRPATGGRISMQSRVGPSRPSPD
ncbi:MAG: hypothetical protein OXC94_11790 [Chloroflexi bacterium]|nr:hypothetical protein [Chloroflexota bacterium]